MVKDVLLKIVSKKSYGLVRYKGHDVLVRFYEHEEELVGTFWIPEEEVDDSVVFSAEIYRTVGSKEDTEKVVDDLARHIEALFDKLV